MSACQKGLALELADDNGKVGKIKRMTFTKAWPETQAFMLEAIKAESWQTEHTALGSGDVAVVELERSLGKALPEEFEFYIRNHLSENGYREFYQDFRLFNYKAVAFGEELEWWGDLLTVDEVGFTALIIGQATAIAFFIDFDDPACPGYRADDANDHIPELTAFSLADFLYLLSFREMLHRQHHAWRRQNSWQVDKQRSKANFEAMKKKLELIAPDSLEHWYLWEWEQEH